jgi:hypothetical protein
MVEGRGLQGGCGLLPWVEGLDPQRVHPGELLERGRTRLRVLRLWHVGLGEYLG